jgi:hypothetical protein
MHKSGDYDADTRDLFRYKLGCFGHVGEEERRLILEDYRAYLAQVLAHTEAMKDRVTKAPELPPAEKRFVLVGMDHQWKLTAFEIEWLDSLLAKPVAGVS